ncbi:tetratricopeptide repeat protein [Roseivirga sp. BDSF3-8]|uniref:tetratricopeptide repeat protein n=1 Tax=Roseivirga sp. BDSF3-8 TaxID=3241598 RepID=UPI0035318CF4
MRNEIIAICLLIVALYGCDSKNIFTEVPDFNAQKNFAAASYIQGEYDTAAYVYGYLTDSAGYLAPMLKLNQASALYQAEDTAAARKQYEQLLDSQDSTIQSQAYNQLGIMALKTDKTEDRSLNLFKNALLTNPDNELARYNYEIIKMYADLISPDEPSDFAKELKEMSDKLVSEHRFGEAYRLMMQGLKMDVTVQQYMDYIQRLGDITEIEENQP